MSLCILLFYTMFFSFQSALVQCSMSRLLDEPLMVVNGMSRGRGGAGEAMVAAAIIQRTEYPLSIAPGL